MRAAELRERGDVDLRQLGEELVRDLWKARFSNHMGQLDNTSKLSHLRRDIARVKTVLAERARAGAAVGGKP